MSGRIMRPLYNKSAIEKRVNAVVMPIPDTESRQLLEIFLAKPPDLERMLVRIHLYTIKVKCFERNNYCFEEIVKLIDSL